VPPSWKASQSLRLTCPARNSELINTPLFVHADNLDVAEEDIKCIIADPNTARANLRDLSRLKNAIMEELFDPVPRYYDPTAPQPTAEAIAAMKAEQAARFGTEAAAMEANPAVNTQLTDGPGVYGYYSASKRYGLRQTVEALREVGAIWARRFPGRRYGVGDISLQGGGDIDGHASHEKGVDADIRLLRIDWVESQTVYTSDDYSRSRTQELIDLLWANSHLAVEFILFNDSQTKGTQFYSNHHNHLHIRFFGPGVGAAPPALARGNDKVAANHELQRCLNIWRLREQRPGPELVVDGDFGARTYDRLREFQSSIGGIPANGIADKPTWAALDRWRA
jgi:peptidoglycan hydrolase-like protein with peptidoglycan-binding domain